MTCCALGFVLTAICRVTRTEGLTQVESAQQALSLGQRVQPETAVHFFAIQTFWLYREQGRLQALLPSVQRLVAQYPAVPAWRSALATIYCDLGQAEAARGEFVRLAGQDFRDLPYTNSWLMSISLLAEVCAFLNDRPHDTYYSAELEQMIEAELWPGVVKDVLLVERQGDGKSGLD